MANQRFNLGDFVSDDDVMAFRNMYPDYVPVEDPEEGSSRQRHRSSHHRRQDRSPSSSRSRSRSRPRKSRSSRDLPPGYDAADPPTPPEEALNHDFFNDKRPHPHGGMSGHHHPPPPPPPGNHGPGGPPPPPGPHGPPPPPGAGPPPPHGHGPWGHWFGPNPRHHPWAGPRGPHGGPHSHGPHGHHRGGFGGRGRGACGRGGRGGRGAFPNMWSYGPWTDMLNNTARGEMNGLNMKDMASAFAEQFGWVSKDETKGKRGAADGDEDLDVDFEPPIDVFDTAAAYLVHVSLPGAKKEDIGLTWDDKSSELKVQGVLTRRVEEPMMDCLEVGERDVGLFRRVVKLGGEGEDAVDGDEISAKMEEGVLIVRVGKKIIEEEFVEVKKVDIQ